MSDHSLNHVLWDLVTGSLNLIVHGTEKSHIEHAKSTNHDSGFYHEV